MLMRNGGPLFRSAIYGLVGYSLDCLYDPELRGVIEWRKLEYVCSLADYLGVEKEPVERSPVLSDETGRYAGVEVKA